jgi:hypothetical protein
MKPATTIVMFLLIAVAITHLLRFVFHVNVIVDSMIIPMWVSIPGCIVPAVLALVLWRENTR